MADPTVRAEILAAVRTPASQGANADDVRILTLNAGGGKDNAWRNENGLDPGDIDQLAERILAKGPTSRTSRRCSRTTWTTWRTNSRTSPVRTGT